MDPGSIIGIVGIVITTIIAVYAIIDAREQVNGLISVERKRVFTRTRNDMVWLFVDPTELAHTPEIAKGLEEFNLISAALDPKWTPDLTQSVVNNEALVFAEKLVSEGYATWKPGWDMEKLKQTIHNWHGPRDERSRAAKGVGLALAAIVGFGIGCYISYAVGHAAGESHGYFRGRQQTDSVKVPEKHRYEFRQNGVSIFRFDLDSGESCWLQLGGADAREEDHLKSPMQQCPK
jgi:hypothetical protein